MKNTYGDCLSLTLFGESHGAAIGAVLDGMAAGVPVDEQAVAACMDRRRARGDGLSTARVEADEVRVLSGVFQGHTTGTPIALMIESNSLRRRTRAVYRRLGLPVRAGFDKEKVYAEMLHDKKAQGGKITVIKVPGLGCWRADTIPVESLRSLLGLEG